MSSDRPVNRSELKRNYREKPPPAGVFAVRSLSEKKIWIGSSMNAQGSLNRIQFELAQRKHRTFPDLQADWERLGAANFIFEILDVLPPPEDPTVDPMEELRVLESLWRAREGGKASSP
jgi:hypothetical protein